MGGHGWAFTIPTIVFIDTSTTITIPILTMIVGSKVFADSLLPPLSRLISLMLSLCKVKSIANLIYTGRNFLLGSVFPQLLASLNSSRLPRLVEVTQPMNDSEPLSMCSFLSYVARSERNTAQVERLRVIPAL